ncbi:RHS repeat domain-containing protein [Paenibacillus camerounensis]|uniref:RHS repeat domain-containing protein n=1 Tax=Paenibacillus camerounensis TaxID=1243663 RepID=UPI0005A79ABA|nr:RHS repeat domain-containing protein [Paenibacillus camerounensis]
MKSLVRTFGTILLVTPILFLSMNFSDSFAFSSTVSVTDTTYKPSVEKAFQKTGLISTYNLVAQTDTDTYRASAGFSSQQGLNQWFYQQWNGSTYSNMTWDSSNGRWKGTPTYTLVMSNAQHPDAQDSVRKWLSPKSGKIIITGNVKKGDTSTGDGVQVKVMKNQQQLWPASGWQIVRYNDSVGYDLNLSTTVNTGDSVYFIVNKIGTTYADTTVWDPVITYENTTPGYLYEYDGAGRLIKLTTPTGKVYVLSYDRNGNLIKKILQP